MSDEIPVEKYDGAAPEKYDPQKAIEELEKQAHEPVVQVPKPDKEGVFIIIKQADGNYIGYAYKNGQPIQVRDIGPETVLQRLITHE